VLEAYLEGCIVVDGPLCCGQPGHLLICRPACSIQACSLPCLFRTRRAHEQLSWATAYPNGALRLAPGSATFSPAMPAGAAVPASAATCGSSAAWGTDACGSAGSLGFMSVAVWCAGAVMPQLRRHMSADPAAGRPIAVDLSAPQLPSGILLNQCWWTRLPVQSCRRWSMPDGTSNPRLTCSKVHHLEPRQVGSVIAVRKALWTLGGAVNTDDELIMVESSSNAVPTCPVLHEPLKGRILARGGLRNAVAPAVSRGLCRHGFSLPGIFDAQGDTSVPGARRCLVLPCQAACELVRPLIYRRSRGHCLPCYQEPHMQKHLLQH
jgi:hypothetical protein